MIIHDLEQGSDEWFRLRAGIPTASNFKKLVTSTGKASTQMKSYAEELAADLIAGEHVDAFKGNHATERGTMLEPAAIAEYQLITGNNVEHVGFITDDHHWYGCSPDGMIDDAGLAEVKCQLAKNFVSTVARYKATKKPPTDYVAQVQGQLWITEREWCDLVLYHPHPNYSTEIIRIKRNDKFIDQLKDCVQQVITLRNEIITNFKR